jgi:hypothetical protein
LIAAAILLITGAYPPQLFDFVMGLNRWCYRVLAYALVMTDEYPPFRLNSGGDRSEALSMTKPVPPRSPVGV